MTADSPHQVTASRKVSILLAASCCVAIICYANVLTPKAFDNKAQGRAAHPG